MASNLRQRVAATLATPTAVTGLLALLVFYACLSLQGFWVAGKKLIERAEQRPGPRLTPPPSFNCRMLDAHIAN